MKSLVVVPIRQVAPVGALGVYWATRHAASADERRILQALADSTSVALESVTLVAELERMAERTAALTAGHDELRRANETLVEIGRRKEHLAALVAHDIKNPASGLMMRAEMRLSGSDMDEDERRAWTSVYCCAEVVARLATNMVDVSRSEAGSFELSCGNVDIRSVLNELERLMRPLGEARSQALEISKTENCAVLADRDVLVRVLVNLVENAIGHNPRGGRVRVEAYPEGDDIVIVVVDEGAGIPVDQRERVFESYVRLDPAKAPRTGRGLGLSFCRLAIEAHGGRIWIGGFHRRSPTACARTRAADRTTELSDPSVRACAPSRHRRHSSTRARRLASARPPPVRWWTRTSAATARRVTRDRTR